MSQSQQVVWTKEKVVTLIEKYESFPELWDTKNKIYKDRTKKQAALKVISEIFETTVAEITRKLHNLRTQMNNELRKLKKRKSGDGADDVTFKSSWEFFDALQFLIGGMTCNETTTSVELYTDNAIDSPQTSGETISRQVDTAQTNTTNTSFNGKKKIKKEDELLNNALAVMQKPDDDENIFGNFVVSSLRSLHSDSNRRKLKRQIQVAILEVTDNDESEFLVRKDSSKDTPPEFNLSFINSPLSATSNTQNSLDLQDISSHSSVTSYYENYGNIDDADLTAL